jgi:multicomponent Na+:H+ antiporter subunit E
MTFFLVNILLAFLWASFQQFRPLDFVAGFLLGYGIIWLTRSWMGAEAARYVGRVPDFVAFLGFYLSEIVVSTFVVVRALFRDQSTLRPGIIAYPLEAKTELEIVLLNNLMVMTPGSVGVDLSEDRSTLYVHFLDVPDADIARERIRTGLERRLLKVLR